MSIHVVLVLWVAASLVLTLMWVVYRRFVGRYSVEDFDAEGPRIAPRRQEAPQV